MRYYCIAPNGRKSYVPKWLYDKRKGSKQYEVGVDKAPADSAYPKHTGAGWYELSNGDTVRGKQDAIEAENSL